MICAVDHINIVVSDLKRSVRFYVDLLGFKEIRRARLQGGWIENVVGLKNVCADVVYIVAPAGEPRIELLCYRSPKGVAFPGNALPNTLGLRHIAFRVDDINKTAEKLKNAGVKFLGPPVNPPSSTVKHDAGKKTLCYFHDPDRVLLELAEYK